jgi:hypothetical protein
MLSFKTPVNVCNSPNFFSTSDNPALTSLGFSYLTADMLLFIIVLSTWYGVSKFFFGRYVHSKNALFYEALKDLLVAFVLCMLFLLWLFDISLG